VKLRKIRNFGMAVLAGVLLLAVGTVLVTNILNHRALDKQRAEAQKREEDDKKRLETKDRALTETVVAYEQRLNANGPQNYPKIAEDLKNKHEFINEEYTAVAGDTPNL